MATNTKPNLSEGIASALGVATKIALITPADDVDNIPAGTRALWIGTAGDLSIADLTGTIHVAVPVLAGIFPLSVKGVRSTGTTAADIYALE